MTDARILKLYAPHAKQLEIHNCKARYRVISFGRQSGKSTWAIQELLHWAWKHPGTTYWLISPTYNQSRILYRRLIGALWNCRQIVLKKNQSELRVKLNNNSQIFCKSGEKPDNLRTETLHGVVIDEMREQHPDLWSMVIQPMLRTTGGWAAFISTPHGFDHFFDIAERAKTQSVPGSSGKWAFFTAPSTCNPSFTQEEFNDAKSNMSEAQFAQEILAEFRDLKKGRAYINYSSAVHLADKSPFTPNGELSPYLPIIVAMDFNLSPMAWTLGQNKVEDFYWHDEIHLESSHTLEAALVLVDKVRQHAPGVILVGDATGKAGQRAAAGQSDYDIVCQTLDAAGVRWLNMTPESNPHIRDRVNAMNAKLKSAAGVTHMWHHPRCIALKKDLERVTWKENQDMVLDSGSNRELTHASDGVGYAVSALSPIPSRFQVGKLRIITR